MLYSQPSGVQVRFLSPATIDSFSATPSAVRTGEEISLSWQVTRIDGHVLRPATGNLNPPTRQALFAAYMDAICVWSNGQHPRSKDRPSRASRSSFAGAT